MIWLRCLHLILKFKSFYISEFGIIITILYHGTWFSIPTCILELSILITCWFYGIRCSYRLFHRSLALNLFGEVKQFVSKIIIYPYYGVNEEIEQFVATSLSICLFLHCQPSVHHIYSLLMRDFIMIISYVRVHLQSCLWLL